MCLQKWWLRSNRATMTLDDAISRKAPKILDVRTALIDAQGRENQIIEVIRRYGDPELVAATDSGAVTVADAAHLVVLDWSMQRRAVKDKRDLTVIELMNRIRHVIWNVWVRRPNQRRPIVSQKFSDFASEVERTGDLDWW